MLVKTVVLHSVAQLVHFTVYFVDHRVRLKQSVSECDKLVTIVS